MYVARRCGCTVLASSCRSCLYVVVCSIVSCIYIYIYIASYISDQKVSGIYIYMMPISAVIHIYREALQVYLQIKNILIYIMVVIRAAKSAFVSVVVIDRGTRLESFIYI